MAGERFVVLGLARVRSVWFSEISRLAASGSVALDFVKCVSPAEVRAHLTSGRSFSAVLADAAVPGVDRELIAAARATGAAVLIVDDERVKRDWSALGASAVLPSFLDSSVLGDALATWASPIAVVEGLNPDTPVDPVGSTVWMGDLTTVISAHGAGGSVVAMGLAQALASRPVNTGAVALADLDLDADLAMYHDARDLLPGLQELCEAHRAGRPNRQSVQSMLFEVPERGYDLLLGLRRHRDWTAVQPTALGASISGLRRAYRQVVADVGPDLEGEGETGSMDVEERNAASRMAVSQARTVVAVGLPTTKGIHELAHLLIGLARHGVPADRVIPVINCAPRRPRLRAEVSRALVELSTTASGPGTALATPLFVPHRRDLEDAHRTTTALPRQIGEAVLRGIDLLTGAVGAPAESSPEPVRVTVGSLGTWLDPDPAR